MNQNLKKNIRHNTLIINFFGGPGSSKSTMATSIFSQLKWRGWNTEYVSEFAKSIVWEKSLHTLDDQFYISANQYHSVFKLIGQVDIVVTDSPIILGLVYAPEEPQCFKDTLLYKFNEMNNINIFLNRKKQYQPIGRIQSEQEAKQKDEEIKRLLLDNNIMFYQYDGTEDSIPTIVNMIESFYKI